MVLELRSFLILKKLQFYMYNSKRGIRKKSAIQLFYLWKVHKELKFKTKFMKFREKQTDNFLISVKIKFLINPFVLFKYSLQIFEKFHLSVYCYSYWSFVNLKSDLVLIFLDLIKPSLLLVTLTVLSASMIHISKVV